MPRLLLILALGPTLVAVRAGAESSPAIRFSRDIRPILAEHCFACHGPDEEARQADLRLDLPFVAAGAPGNTGDLIVPGQPDQSHLFQRIISADDTVRMPPADDGKPLSSEQVELIRRWIDDGADWQQHWAYAAPHKRDLPVVTNSTWGRNEIDRFVLRRLEGDGMAPSPEADRRTLVRRVTLDLSGLPPTIDEIESFLRDNRPAAYERLVDRLLSSPRYGERMAIDWLDAARYADTHGYLFDTARTMWRWRDWVIDAYNSDMPFDQFTIDQLAGDLLPNPTLDQQIATGFNRNHIINNEAGAIPAEYLVENIVDRVNTTTTVWMGLTLQCCQCHDHKYDPFTQRDFYSLYAFFNNLPEAGLDGLNSNAKPLMKAPTSVDVGKVAKLEQQVEAAESQIREFARKIQEAQTHWESTLRVTAPPIPTHLAAHWHLDEKGEDTCSSSASTVFEAAPAKYQEGLFGSAAALDGLGYLNAGDRFNFAAGDSFTISAWLRPSTIQGRLTVVSRMLDADKLFRGYALQLVNGLPAMFLLDKFPDAMIQVQGKTALQPNRWQHVAVTYDGSKRAEGVRIYLNGVLQEPGIKLDTLSDGEIQVDRPFWIGNGHPGAKFKGAIDDVRIFERTLGVDEVNRLPGLAIDSLLAVKSEDRSQELKQRIEAHYLENHAPGQWRVPFQMAKRLKEEVKAKQEAIPTVMVMRERDEPRETKMLVRGAYNQPGETVTSGVPALLLPWDDELPENRLGLAMWMVDPQHPLTARVAVNRIWQSCFGAGLVKTSEDFGVQSEPPTHPQLLDWLAVEFVESGWNVKSLHRKIVTSAAYRQSSMATPVQAKNDPQNRLLGRGPRHRLPAELIRDHALSASGLMVGEIGGPSVKPYQPAGLWRDVAFDFSGANLTAQVYAQDQGPSLYRRSMYTFWKRTAPPPVMLLFDAPDRERCVVRREQTNTPLQALALMNDPTFVEASRKLAERMMVEGGSAPSERIGFAFEVLTSRRPSSHELELVVQLQRQQVARFAKNQKEALELLAVGDSPRNELLNAVELASYTIIANVLLNLDETITKH